MKKVIYLVFQVISIIGVVTGRAQDCNTSVKIVSEDFNVTPDPNDRSILSDCWQSFYASPSSGREIGSIQLNNGQLLINSTYGGIALMPPTENELGVITFDAGVSTRTPVELGVYDGTFHVLATFSTAGSQTYDFSGNTETGLIGFRHASTSGCCLNLSIDNVEYISRCDNPGNPTAVSQNITVQLDETGNVTVNPSLLNNGSVDDCGLPISIFSLDKSTFTCDDLGDNAVVFTVEDERGATANEIATITVEPSVFIDFSGAIIYLDENGEANFTAEDLLSDFSTTCSQITYSFNNLSFDCTDLGTRQDIILTASYGGLTTTRTGNYSVGDTINPSNIVVNNLAVNLDATSGLATLTADQLISSASDNCSSTFTYSATKTNFSCADLGENVVTVYVFDGNGNYATVGATVTVNSSIMDQALSTTTGSFCPDGSSNSATIDMASSELDVNYYLRNSTTQAILDGPVAGTGGALSFTGSISETTTVYVFAESAPTDTPDFALDFDGTDDKIATTYVPSATTELTIEGWIYPRSSNIDRILSNYNGSGALSDGDIFIDTYDAAFQNGRALRFSIVGAGGARLAFGVANVLTLNAWNHIAFTFDNGAVKIYLDGVEVGSSTASFSTIPATTFPIHLGEDGGGSASNYFNGLMDDFRIWNAVRTASDLLSNKDIRLSGTETGLEAYYNFDQGSGTTLTDLVSAANGTLTNMDANTDWVNGVGHVVSNVCDTRLSTEITLGDVTPPSAVAQNLTIQLDASGNESISASDLDNGSSDNCTDAASLVLALDQSDFDCTMIGANDVAFIVTDASGNSDTAMVVVTVESILVDETLTSDVANVCPGSEATVSFPNSITGFNYYLQDQDDNVVDGPLLGNGNTLDFSTGTIAATTTYNMYVEGEKQLADNEAIIFGEDADGSDVFYAEIPFGATTQFASDWTIETWFNSGADPLQQSDGGAYIFNLIGSYYTTGGFMIRAFMVNDEVRVQAFAFENVNNNVFTAATTDAGTGFPEATWGHIAVTFDESAGKISIYLNGELAGEAINIIDAQESRADIQIGANGSLINPALGQDHYQDEVRIWNVARSQNQIQNNLNVSLLGNETGLVGYYDFNEVDLANGIIEDKTGVNNISDILGTLSSSLIVEGASALDEELCGVELTNTVTILSEDTEAPVVVTKDIVLLLENDAAAIEVTDIDNGSSDNCTAVGELVYSLDITSFSVNDLGDNTVTLSVTDASGNVGTATALVTISDKTPQIITFDEITDKVFGGSDFELTASTDSQLPITFSVVSGGVTISGTTATITSAGIATIRASQAGDATFGPSEVDRTFNIAKADQILTVDQIANQNPTSGTITVNASVNSGLSLTYSVSGPATISGNVVSLDGTIGTVTVTVDQSGSANYNAVSQSTSFDVVNKTVQTVTFAGLLNKTFGDADFTIVATTDSNLPVTFTVTSGGLSIVTSAIGSSGGGEATFTIAGAGIAKIEVSNDGDATYAPYQSVITMPIAKAEQVLTIDPISDQASTVSTVTINAGVDTGLPLTYAVTGPATNVENIITLDGSLGTVNVTVTQVGSDDYNAMSGMISFDVIQKTAQTITFGSFSDLTYGAGDLSVIGTATASSGLPVSYEYVSGPAIFADNILQITGAGTIVMQAFQYGDNTFAAAAPVQRSIVVNKAVLSLTGDDKTITYGDQLPDFTYTLSGLVNGDTEADANISVNTSVSVGQADAGTYPITVSVALSGDGSNYRFTSVDGTLTIAKADQVITIDPIADKTPTDAAFDVVATVDSGLDLTYDVAGPAIISGTTITLDGTAGTVTVTVTQVGTTNYLDASATMSFEVVAIVAGVGDLAESIKVYPNPAVHFVNIELAKAATIRLMNLDGKVLMERVMRHGSLDLIELSAGVYLLQIVDGDQVSMHQIIKN